MASPLDGIRVVDFTEYIAGPYATMMLADMGADIVKIERPTGDTWRHTADRAGRQRRAVCYPYRYPPAPRRAVPQGLCGLQRLGTLSINQFHGLGMGN